MNSRYEKNKKEIRRIKREDNRKRNIIIISIILPIILILFFWGRFGAVNILKSNYFSIESSDIPNSFNNVRIVHFSDVHYGIGIKEKKLERIIMKINSYEPDIVVFTGDLIDKDYNATDDDNKKIIENLSKIKARLGKYAIMGDQDYNNDNYDNIMYDSKIKLLKNNYDIVYNKDNNPILLYGFDDMLKGDPKPDSLNKKSIKNIAYKIALIHEPDYANEIANDYNLNLIFAGHSMYGQVKVPFIKPLHLPKGAKDYYKKEYDINGTNLYISGGVGQTKYNFRLFTAPSINIYELKTK